MESVEHPDSNGESPLLLVILGASEAYLILQRCEANVEINLAVPVFNLVHDNLRVFQQDRPPAILIVQRDPVVPHPQSLCVQWDPPFLELQRTGRTRVAMVGRLRSVVQNQEVQGSVVCGDRHLLN